MHKSTKLIPLLAGVVLVAAACSSSGASTSPGATSVSPSTAPSAGGSAAPSEAAAPIDPNSLLGKIVAAGQIKISTDPNYKPFSFLNVATKKYEGFDTGTAEETVKRLSTKVGKEIKIKWETPGWDTITAGSWGGRWDISIGSMSVTVERAKHVDFVEPYYFDSGAVAVPKDSPVQTLAELNDGKTFCVGASTTYEQWLKGTLQIVDPNIVAAPTTPKVQTLPTDNECIQAVNAGRKFDAIVANGNGLADAAKSGAKIRVLEGPPIFTVSVAFALDKSGADDASLKALLDQIVTEMHADGALKTLSEKWFEGKDVTTKPT